MLNKRLRKILFRILVTLITFFLIKFTHTDIDDLFSINPKSVYYFTTSIFFFLTTWELNDWLINKHIRKNQLFELQWISEIKIFILTVGIMFPVYGITYYIGIFHFNDYFNFDDDANGPWVQLGKDFIRALIICITVVAFNIAYYSKKIKKQFENKMIELQKEVIEAKYKSLKSQISPHFLFNSLNTLTSLMYQDRDLASDFTSKLATCYRYILDNSNKDIINLEKELAFMDSYIFMMNVRHQKSLNINVDIKLKTNQYALPTLTLQMLVENALKHNYYSKEKPLNISIKNDEKFLIVSNTLYKRKVVEISTGLGLDNIKKRFSYFTDIPVDIIEDEISFKVTLPLLNKNVEKKIRL